MGHFSASIPGGLFWTFNKNTKTCNVKSSNSGRRTDWRAVSGNRKCGITGCIEEDGIDYNGDTIPGGRKTTANSVAAPLPAPVFAHAVEPVVHAVAPVAPVAPVLPVAHAVAHAPLVKSVVEVPAEVSHEVVAHPVFHHVAPVVHHAPAPLD